MTDLVPQTVGHNTTYNLRNNVDYIEPHCRLEVYKQSYLPSSLSMWNSLPISVRKIDNLNLFRKMKTKDIPKVPKYYCSGKRKYSVYHTRIRSNCSNLNVDLYYNHLSQTEACDCGDTSETPQHFFF